MNFYIFLFGLINSYANGSPRTELSDVRKTKTIPAVDVLIKRLEDQRWKPDDEPCLHATLDMLRGVKNNTLWAVWAWDSMQPPVGSLYGSELHLGNYDQCLRAPWSSKDHSDNPGLRTQYCIVDVTSEAVEEIKDLEAFDDAEEYFRTPMKSGRRFNKQHFGACLPATCSASSVGDIFTHFHQLTHLPHGEVFVDPRDCQKAGEVVEYSKGFYVFWSVVGALFTTAVLSSFLSNVDAKEMSFVNLITSSFNMKRNFNALFTISPNEIKVMNGMRFITAAAIVLIHEGFHVMLLPVVNGLEMNEVLNSASGKFTAHSEVVVDTFFAMSGLLLVMGLMMGKQKNVFYTLVKRYIRLIGPFAICTLYLTTAVMDMDSGPMWKRFNREEVEACAVSWWRNILMANSNTDTLCHVTSWYVSCDFQLAILATFLFYLFRRNKKLGVTAFLVVAAAVFLNLGFSVYWNKFDILPFNYKTLRQHRGNTALNYTYFKSYVRAGPYLVGMVMGYILTTYKPREHRNILSKEWSVIMTVGSLAAMTAVLSIEFFFSGRPYDALEAAVVVSTNRVVWAAAVCCIIGVCEYGSVPLITSFLSWPRFVPLSKLSYGLYLLHPFILQKQKYALRNPSVFRFYSMFINGFGVLVAGCAASFVLFLILEAPLINISNALLSERPKSLEQNGVKSNNEEHAIPYQNGHAKTKIS